MSVVRIITRTLAGLLSTRGVARIALPGGRSAIQLMTELSQAEIDWSSVNVTLVDERAVDMSSSASNARLVLETLCVNRAATVKFEPLFVAHTALASADLLNQADSPLDIVVLGMGEDGHFASLFPNQNPVAGLDDTFDGFVATDSVGSPMVPRISMTLTRILSAQLVILLVSSEEKKDRVMTGLQRLDPMNPVSYLLQANHPLWVEWPDGTANLMQQGAVQ
ncbi:MAG: 6-phosphogluconolactonase [Gammaproteobacteria bacterium]|nr:6-phosphogluconolactonase [Gammaproteobacteria bacterium]